MTELLLYVSEQSKLTDVIIWAILIAMLLFAIILLFWQRKVGESLSLELSQLDKVKKKNVEYDFVLRAMRLSTWHIDPKTMMLTFDNDFRGYGNEWMPDDSGSNVMESTFQLHENDSERVRQSMDDLCSGRKSEYHEQYQVKVPHTSKTYWEESYAMVVERDINGMPLSIIGTSMRIDERKAIEEALVEARFRAEESDRLKTAFLANMSHEIRTPLNAIVGFTALLPDVQEAEERSNLLNLIHENTQKLLRIVDDVVSISKIESGQEEAVMTSFDLVQVLSVVVDQYMPNVKPGVVLSTDFASPTQLVTTDLNRLQEIMRHLISNATKFTDQGAIVVGFNAPQNDRIKMWVTDTGKGIAPEHHKRIFERFFKVDEFIPGAGLGLSTCEVMAYSLGGSVKVESALGQGATFTVEIPIQG
jgi:signal transduction histidine kinase